MNKGTVGLIAYILVIVGAINLGLVGLGSFLGGNWDVIGMVLGGFPQVMNVVLILIGLSGVYMLAGKK